MITKCMESCTDSITGEKFNGGILFISGNRCLLHEKKGHILIMDKAVAEQLTSNKIQEPLRSVLYSRGFLGDSTHMSLCIPVKPEFIMIDLTNRCNMACEYCLRNITNNGTTIKEDVLRQVCNYIVEYCDNEGLQDISVQAWGGEPLLEIESIIKMRRWIQPKRTRVHMSIETNATLLTDSVIEKLYENKIGIGISIDGIQECHDSQRVSVSGKGTHSIVERNLKHALLKYGSDLGIITTITKKNKDRINDILEYYATDLGLKSIKINYVHKSKFLAKSEQLCLSNDEIEKAEITILNKITELIERGYNIYEKNIRTKVQNLLFLEYSDICISKGCSGGKKMIVIGRDGSIFPCELTDFPSEAIGSIYQTEITLTKMIEKSIECRGYYIPKQEEQCLSCPWYVYCGGGCTVRVMNSDKKPPEIDSTECSINKVLYPALIELILNKPIIINKMLGYDALIYNEN